METALCIQAMNTLKIQNQEQGMLDNEPQKVYYQYIFVRLGYSAPMGKK